MFRIGVMPREGHGSRNPATGLTVSVYLSCPARGMGVEMCICIYVFTCSTVMPREGHGSRNDHKMMVYTMYAEVMPREGHGSRNIRTQTGKNPFERHAPRGAWE